MKVELELIGTREAAVLLAVSDRRVRQLCRTGELRPALSLRGRHVFLASDVRALRADREAARAKRREAVAA